ncbi:T6SS effector BTH_I2691 family protein [Mangrovibacter phragmitis]|uniref:T6SS effector BTH_I2691 family protein n=1 Tax=Mangrovibacter phragmitis TaxID=1691903 RepID=UPI00336AD854
MNIKEQIARNALAARQAAAAPSGCKACSRQGVAIYPLRVAAVPAFLVHPAWRPAVPEQAVPLAGGEFKYALRTLRGGYVYVLLDGEIWQGYQVTPEGYLRQFNVEEMPASPDIPPLNTACRRQHHDILASFITIAPHHTDIRMAFSSDPWSMDVLDAWRSKNGPSARFTQLTLSGGQVSATQPHRHRVLEPSLDTLKAQVAEFAVESFPSVAGRGGTPGGAHGFYPRTNREKQRVLGMHLARAEQQYGAPVSAVVLDDIVGVVQELNHSRLDVTDALAAYTGQKRVIHQLMVSESILALREGTRLRVHNDPQLKGFSTPGYHGSFSVSREVEVALRTHEALRRMERFYHEPARAEFAREYESMVGSHHRRIAAIWQDLARLQGSAAWQGIMQDDYAPERSVLSWSFLLRTLASCLHGGPHKDMPEGRGGQAEGNADFSGWRAWLENPASPLFVAMLGGAKVSAGVFSGLFSYADLKSALTSSEVSQFVNSEVYQRQVASLVTAVNGAFAHLRHTLPGRVRNGVERVVMAVGSATTGGPGVGVFTGEMTVRDFQSLVRRQLTAHGRPLWTTRTAPDGQFTRTTSARHPPQITDAEILNRRIRVRLALPLNSPELLAGITGMTPEAVNSALKNGDIALSDAEIKRVARAQARLSPHLQSGILGLVLAGVMVSATADNLAALKSAMPGDTRAEMALASGVLILMASAVEIVGQSAAVLNLFNKGDILLRAAGVIAGLAVVIQGVALWIKGYEVWEFGDKMAGGFYVIAGSLFIISGGMAMAYSAAGKFTLLGPVGWCIALGILAATLVAVGNRYIRSPLERWLSHCCFGNRNRCDEREPVWHPESLEDLQECLDALAIITSGVSVQLRYDRLAGLTKAAPLPGTRLLAARVILADCHPENSAWRVELAGITHGGIRQVLACSASADQQGNLPPLQPQTYEALRVQYPRADVMAPNPQPVRQVTAATTLAETWYTREQAPEPGRQDDTGRVRAEQPLQGPASGSTCPQDNAPPAGSQPEKNGEQKKPEPHGLQLDGTFPLNTTRFKRAELSVVWWPDKSLPDEYLQLATHMD